MLRPSGVDRQKVSNTDVARNTDPASNSGVLFAGPYLQKDLTRVPVIRPFASLINQLLITDHVWIARCNVHQVTDYVLMS